MRIAILGGSFDPVHNAHICLAERALADIPVDKVLFIPTNVQPLKSAAKNASPEERLEMVRIATRSNPNFEVSDIEVRRRGLSYTVETLRELHELHQAADFFFLAGSDSLRDLPKWRKPEEILKLCVWVCYERKSSFEREKVGGNSNLVTREEIADPRFPGARIMRFAADIPGISSTLIREMTARGESIANLVPQEVADFIAAKKLYKKQKKSAANGTR